MPASRPVPRAESRVGDAGRALVQNSSFVLISRPVSFAVNARSRRMEAPSSSDDAGLSAAAASSRECTKDVIKTARRMNAMEYHSQGDWLCTSTAALKVVSATVGVDGSSSAAVDVFVGVFFSSSSASAVVVLR